MTIIEPDSPIEHFDDLQMHQDEEEYFFFTGNRY